MATNIKVLEVHKFIDIDGDELPANFIEAIRDSHVCTYMDVHPTEEHIYSIADMDNHIKNDGMNDTHRIIFDTIKKVVETYNAAYFRITFS